MKKEYTIKGIDCPSCVAKIEDQLNKDQNISDASIDLMQEKLVLDIHSLADNEAKEYIQNVIEHIEDDVIISERTRNHQVNLNNHQHDHDDHEHCDHNHANHEENEDHDHEHDQSNVLIIRSVIAALLTAVAYFLFSGWFAIIIYIIAYLVAGYDVLLKAFKKLGKKQMFDENFLMSIATIGAFFIKEYPEAVLVMVFYQVGEYIQSLAVNNSRKSIAKLMNIRPDFARVLKNNQEQLVNPEIVSIDDIIVCYPGEKIPLDGEVIDGQSEVDLKMLTGESAPQEVKEGKKVLSGSINLSGLIKIRVEQTYGSGTVSKILDLVENASSKKATSELFITKFSRIYTPLVVLGAVLLAIIPPLFLNQSFNEWLYRALVFLVISCPCALVLSIPVTFFAGIGSASKRGILVKGSNYLEAITQIDGLVFDKTGTLTQGVFKVNEVVTYGSNTQNDVIEYAAIGNAHSNHPIALSIKSYYNQDIKSVKISKFDNVAGKGSVTIYDNQRILVGNQAHMEDYQLQVNIPNNLDQTIVFVAIDEIVIGYILLGDQLKPDSKQALSELKQLGIKKMTMLTGDKDVVAKSIANKLGIDQYYAELLPQDKVEKFEMLQSQNHRLGFVGDGINDAPVLMLADVGIAMGGVGQDAAIEAADIILMTDHLSQLVDAIRVAKKTRRIVMQNIVFVLLIKFIILGLSVFGIASMWLAIFADVGVSLLATLNAVRAFKLKGE